MAKHTQRRLLRATLGFQKKKYIYIYIYIYIYNSNTCVCYSEFHVSHEAIIRQLIRQQLPDDCFVRSMKLRVYIFIYIYKITEILRAF